MDSSDRDRSLKAAAAQRQGPTRDRVDGLAGTQVTGHGQPKRRRSRPAT
ncbi:hypothetical protein TVNIR_2256 [Thioalkalivibrio nitratireducens DSM 14787]|uniref:Uncharacterized protein n=1 Tax=Thioalkalivibrio nitratireducens (strain DSM 14787 / UNIQEM 213 / ALEN2) TaxID=1255043 RepID=L0DY39_THIND|nr:hypothetical protein [Thioalkalivibrio nitratireducens]AGA33912.1 hypothetical protein TVNIR_2256 [Thioalkalivibrio nitratireducens DSM 14787]